MTLPAAGAASVLTAGAEEPQPVAECHIWSLPPLPQPSKWFGLLDSTELVRTSSFAHELDLARFVTGRMLAKTALALAVGTGPEAIRLHTRCPGCGGPHGKPRPVGIAEGWELSISHSGDIVSVAIALGIPLGLDVERFEPWRGPGLPPEYELVLTPAERAAVERLPEGRRVRACLTYWVRKEAVLKATGEGLNTPMTDFTLSGPEEPPALLSWHGPDAARPVPAIADVALDDGHPTAVAALGARCVRATVHRGTELLPGRPPARGRPAQAPRIASAQGPPAGQGGVARFPGAPRPPLEYARDRLDLRVKSPRFPGS
ncbi:4'-phosphopantetheinyl transferase superfamily protein (plasmid) [Streptomyces sp. NBC_01136]|uniref:4'-phosphopantetheinyl transferase family protein n=1 Tax=unclassified Streptomyces TaxID=2593676 RepID=UPI002F910148|nr:4'-phosphopantetheinyl transferase superfamily protein [Streptomyces sp. NBC_01136]